VVYGLLAAQAGIPTGDRVFDLVAITIALSIVLHSSTDVPIVKALRVEPPDNLPAGPLPPPRRTPTPNPWLTPTLLPAVLVMVAFALIFRRYRYSQLPAVLGWAIVWTDNHLTWHWTDLAGPHRHQPRHNPHSPAPPTHPEGVTRRSSLTHHPARPLVESGSRPQDGRR
jgi:hypothetical protein